MTKKENEDLAHLFMTFLHEAKESDSPEDVSNLSVDMVKDILKCNPQIRYIMWQYNQHHHLDEFNLDYGQPKW